MPSLTLWFVSVNFYAVTETDEKEKETTRSKKRQDGQGKYKESRQNSNFH